MAAVLASAKIRVSVTSVSACSVLSWICSILGFGCRSLQISSMWACPSPLIVNSSVVLAFFRGNSQDGMSPSGQAGGDTYLATRRRSLDICYPCSSSCPRNKRRPCSCAVCVHFLVVAIRLGVRVERTSVYVSVCFLQSRPHLHQFLHRTWLWLTVFADLFNVGVSLSFDR